VRAGERSPTLGVNPPNPNQLRGAADHGPTLSTSAAAHPAFPDPGRAPLERPQGLRYTVDWKVFSGHLQIALDGS